MKRLGRGMVSGREGERFSNAMGGYGGELLGRYFSVFSYHLTPCQASFPVEKQDGYHYDRSDPQKIWRIVLQAVSI